VDPQVVRYSERPELWKALSGLTDEVRPEYNHTARRSTTTGASSTTSSPSGSSCCTTPGRTWSWLATVHIDRERDTGEYWEPNIWIIHEAAAG
jgi:hypothetical protein